MGIINIYKYGVVLFLILFMIFFGGFMLFVIINYYILKWLKENIDNNHLYINHHSPKNKDIMEKYGNYRINKFYLVREPINRVYQFIINIITFFRFERKWKKYMETINGKTIFPQHTAFILEIEMPTKLIKQIRIEKHTSIKLSMNFDVCEKQDIQRVNVKKHYTLNTLLEETRERIGDKTFFNWHICKNNCQMLMKEILVTLKKCNKKNKDFMFWDFTEKIDFSEFSLHIVNCIINLNVLLLNLVESIPGIS